MKILHTIARYFPEQGGGASEVVRQISERLAQKGHDVTVGTGFSRRRTEFLFGGVKIKQFKIDGWFHQSVLGVRGDIEAFRSELTNGGYEVVMNYAAQTWHFDLTCRFLSEVKAKKAVCACGYSGLVGWRRLLYSRYFKRLPGYLRQYDRVIYHSANYRDTWFGQKHGIRNFSVIPNGVDSAAFGSTLSDSEFRRKYKIKTKHLLLSVGDHFTNKGHKRIIQVISTLGRSDVTLLIIGRDLAHWPSSCWNECSSAAEKSNGKVVLLSNAPRSDVLAAYKCAKIFLSASKIEAFPLVILEAMASGTPFIAFPAGNIPELEGGIVVNSTSEMALSIKRLLDDESSRDELAAKGIARQRRDFEWDAVAEQYESLYLKLLDPTGSRFT